MEPLYPYIPTDGREGTWEQRLESYAKELVSVQGEYYPFSQEHIGEALRELNLGQLCVLTVNLQCLIEDKTNNPFFAEFLARDIRKYIEDYWYEIALYKAEQQIKE